MSSLLQGFTVAILVANGFQQNEMLSPRKALEEAGAIVHIVSTERGTVQGWDWNIPQALDTFAVDVHIDRANAARYDALLLPGGLSSPDDLRMNPRAIAFVQGFANKPIAAICHGPQILIDAHLVAGKKITSYPSIKEDLKNAGALWIDEAAVRDGNLVTSRAPEDLFAFNHAMLKIFMKANKLKKKTTHHRAPQGDEAQ